MPFYHRVYRHGELPSLTTSTYRRLAVVKLEVLLLAGSVNSPHGSDMLSSTYEKSLREIADFKEPKSAPAGLWQMAFSDDVPVYPPLFGHNVII
jgi:hypothetical protein